MSDSDRGSRIAVIGPLCLLLSLAFAIGMMIGGLPKPEEQGGASRCTTSNSSECPTPTAHTSRVTAPPASDLQPSANDQSYYTREDLQAQRIMAWWTRIMGFAAAIGIALGGISIWLIWQTWDATRQTALTAAANTQAYVAIEAARIRIVQLGGDLLSRQIKAVPITLGAVNVGRARCVIDGINYSISDNQTYTPNFDKFTNGSGVSLGADDKSKVIEPRIPTQNLPAFIKGVVTYSDALGSEKKAHFVFHISVKGMMDAEQGFAILRVQPVGRDGWPSDT